MADRELFRETERECDGDGDGAIWIAEDEARDDLTDDTREEGAKEPGLEESKGVLSDGGSPVLVLASRLQTGQKVLHDVSQESTQKAWNSTNSKKK